MEKITSRNLYNKLFSAADDMRFTMAADVYKDYLLGLIFYKNLSDKQLYEAVDLLEDRKPDSLDEAQAIYEAAKDSDEWEDLVEELTDKYGCAIEPKYTFTAFYQQINEHKFMLSDLRQGFRDIEQAQNGAYADLFEDFDIDSKDLGKTPEKRNEMLSSVIRNLAAIDFTKYGKDALGDAYEYLIAQFASESGKKAGEFYTPQQVSKLITRIVTHGKEKKDGFSIYDPCMGSGSLLLQIKNYMYQNPDTHEDYTKHIFFYGQENKNQTYNLARMNMILHQVPAQYQHLRNGDTLDKDWPDGEMTNFDGVVMNPPYSQKYSSSKSLLTDARFQPYEKLAPASKADYAFLLHGFYHLKQDGTMGIVLPHGVLFRGAAEGVIRRHLLEDGSIYAVIGLPANIFYSTGIPTCVIILKKNNKNRDVLFIDASKDFIKEKAQNHLTDEHIDKIFQTYIERKDVEKYAHLASYEEIAENDFNLNIPRYVDTFEPEPEVDLQAEFKAIAKLKQESKQIDSELDKYFKELGL